MNPRFPSTFTIKDSVLPTLPKRDRNGILESTDIKSHGIRLMKEVDLFTALGPHRIFLKCQKAFGYYLSPTINKEIEMSRLVPGKDT